MCSLCTHVKQTAVHEINIDLQKHGVFIDNSSETFPHTITPNIQPNAQGMDPKTTSGYFILT